FVIVRRLPGGLSSEDQHSAHADRLARIAASRPAEALGTVGVFVVARSVAPAVALSTGRACCPAGSPAVGPRGLAAALARSRRGLDGGPRLSSAGGPLVPRPVARMSVRPRERPPNRPRSRCRWQWCRR